MTLATPGVITRYFSTQAARNWDAMVALFTDDAVVVDEGQTRRGSSEIRAWREMSFTVTIRPAAMGFTMKL
jgi:uncharacterized protein (TIGR02246 family)